MPHLIIARPTMGASLRYMHCIARLLMGTPIPLCQKGERLGTQRRTIAEEFLWGMLRGRPQSLSTACTGLPPAFAPTSLRLLAAGEAWPAACGQKTRST